jgi:uncharacterized membrane protein YvbJ
MPNPKVFPRKCEMCGRMLSDDEERICLYCAQKSTVEQKQANEDKQRWKDREMKGW